MGEGILTWTELEQIFDGMESAEGGLTPEERRFAESAMLAGFQRMGRGEVSGYADTGGKTDSLTEGQFNKLAEKLRGAADSLPTEQRALARDAFMQGAASIYSNDDVDGYALLSDPSQSDPSQSTLSQPY